MGADSQMAYNKPLSRYQLAVYLNRHSNGKLVVVVKLFLVGICPPEFLILLYFDFPSELVLLLHFDFLLELVPSHDVVLYRTHHL